MAQITPTFTLSSQGRYITEVAVSSEFIVHIEFANPAHMAILRNTGGAKYAFLSSFQNITIVERTYHIGAESMIKISLDSIPELCVITNVESASGSGSLNDTAETLSTPEIDSASEVRQFLSDYDNTKTLKDVVSGTVDDEGIVHY